LLLHGQGLVKTIRFQEPRYLGDPINTVKIFNDKGVDELCILDIDASKEQRGPDFEYLQLITSEAFMPLGYGGGITSVEQIQRLLKLGFEKVIINTGFYKNNDLIRDAVKIAGSQSVVVSIDVKSGLMGKHDCYIMGGREKVNESPKVMAELAQELGAGEILLNSISHDGVMQGYDLKLVKMISNSVTIPVIACGGAKNIFDMKKVLDAGASAAAAGSMYVYYGKHNAVLISAPKEDDLISINIYGEEK
jgi:cyclase